MTTSIQKWGNSQGLRIPKMLLDAVKWSENEKVTITVYDGKLIIEKAKKEKESIMELFENYEEEYTPEEVDWGKPEGKEVWWSKEQL